MRFSIEQVIRVGLNEAFANRWLMVGLFIAINLTALVVGLGWQRGASYQSSTTILIDDKNIIQPLMQGAAVTTDVRDRARIAREIIFGQRIMGKIMEIYGLRADTVSALEKQAFVERMEKRTRIVNVGPNLIKIEFRDPEAKRAYSTTKTLADLFLAASVEAKAAESKAAYEFIEAQAEEYLKKLTEAEERLKEYRSANLDARVGTEAQVGARIDALQQQIEQAKHDLVEAEIRKSSLEKQMSGEAEVATALTREGQFRARISELQSQIDNLRLTYHDTYPDIVRMRHQIEDLEESIIAERQRRDAARAAGKPLVDDLVVHNPLYAQLRSDVSRATTEIDTLKARIAEYKRQLNEELDRGRRVNVGEVTLAEVTRDYEVNRDIYRDLLKRREAARVSMNLDRDQQGLSFRIQEPASVPVQPIGLRFLHFAIGGLVLGLLLPLGLVVAKFQLDPRIRLPAILSEQLKLPLVAVLPHFSTPSETATVQREMQWLFLLLLANGAVFVTVSALRLGGVI
jgi:polysaccharide chain length determinant protein (PEP-CTERM system associated)